ncbi:4'-phosphopantetheinyl transferase family protein [Cryptosporangium aurantiacum]|uniref:4'-phosphopantetheinyl transferase n=1 Tax=Cryptosporangium aurantiacum TaxID=134849 RepID=A0A1M7QBT9_9ACTN|nr:4'-phosphopantetheinyl transferase superfamily protein [Cryptosporangium aurantiacum]SHN28148.1 4'-phosphopantetheinyl transferase [Cryptosporangium aurantiacum]
MLIRPLAPGECQVWWARPLTDASPDALAGLLDDVERSRRATFRRDEDRARFTVAAALLRLLGGAHLGVAPERLTVTRSCPDCDRPHGRPALPAAGWECSVSHSGDRVAVAIGRTGALGVDVEAQVRRADVDVREMVLSPEESAAPDELITYWVRKEAVLKATGEGLRVGLKQVVVSPADAAPALVRAHRDDLPGRTVLRTLDPGAGYRACLAVLDTPTPAVTELDAGPVLAEASSR